MKRITVLPAPFLAAQHLDEDDTQRLVHDAVNINVDKLLSRLPQNTELQWLHAFMYGTIAATLQSLVCTGEIGWWQGSDNHNDRSATPHVDKGLYVYQDLMTQGLFHYGYFYCTSISKTQTVGVCSVQV